MAFFGKPKAHSGAFGSCCPDLHAALHSPSTSFFRVEDNGVLYLTVGFARTADGTGYFDQAVLFCPFCGATLQDKATIAQRSGGPVQ